MLGTRATQRSFAAVMLDAPHQKYLLENERTGEAIATELEGAFTRQARNRGLLGRDLLPPGHGLLIAPCSSIHTFWMRFAIDVIFVSSDGRVRKIAHAVPPWRLAFGFGAFAVIELPANTVAGTALSLGDTLRIK